jgi:hypothetical protein
VCVLTGDLLHSTWCVLSVLVVVGVGLTRVCVVCVYLCVCSLCVCVLNVVCSSLSVFVCAARGVWCRCVSLYICVFSAFVCVSVRCVRVLNCDLDFDKGDPNLLRREYIANINNSMLTRM